MFRLLCLVLALCACVQAGGVGKFIQIADPHIDEQYLVGSSPVCNTPLCCRAINESVAQKAGPEGTYVNCDLPLWSYEAALSYVASQEPAFVVQSGDLICHDIWEQSRDSAVHRLGQFSAYFLKHFDVKQTPIYHAIGNHDTYPVDQFDVNWQWLLQPLSDSIWAPFFTDPSQATTMAAGGYYYADVPGTPIRVVTVNTQWLDPINFYSFDFPADPANQLAWLEATLADAEQRGKRVFMVGHIPYGISYSGTSAETAVAITQKILTIFEQYSHIIEMHLSGHVHTDTFRVLKSANGTCFGVQYVSPSLTMWTDLDPAVREFQYDTETGKLLAVVTHAADLGKANAAGTPLAFEPLYSMVDAYSKYMTDLSCESFETLRKALWTDDEAWGKFMVYHRGGHGKPTDCATIDCKARILCAMGYMDFQSHAKCMVDHN